MYRYPKRNRMIKESYESRGRSTVGTDGERERNT